MRACRGIMSVPARCQKQLGVVGMFGFLMGIFLIALLLFMLGSLFWWGIPFIVLGLGLVALIVCLIRGMRT